MSLLYSITAICYITIKMAVTRVIVKKNTRLAIKRVQDIEEIYYTMEQRFAELSRCIDRGQATLQQQKEYDKLSSQLDSLAENLTSSEDELFAQLKADGSWKAKLIGYWWRSWRQRRY